MSHFGNDGGGGDTRLYISISPDGLNWTALNSGQPVYAPPAYNPTTNLVRDPSILYANGFYWVAYTSGRYGAHASFGLAKSADLLTWQYVGEVSTALPNATDPLTWSPCFFEDGDGSAHVLVNVSPINGSGFGPTPAMQSYEVHPTNAAWTQWSAPVLVPLPSSNTNELWVWKEADVYHAIYVNFENRANYYHSTAPALLGPWSAGKVIGFPSLEGGFILKRPEGGYRIYIEEGNGHPGQVYYAFDTDAVFTAWGPKMTLQTTVGMRNGKAIAVPTGKTYDAWCSQYAAPLAGQLADPAGDADGDGIANAVEAVMGSDPGVAREPVRVRRTGTAAAPWLAYRLAGGFSDLAVATEVSGNLQSWSSGPSVTQRLSSTLMTDGTREVVEVLPVPASGTLQAVRLTATRLTGVTRTSAKAPVMRKTVVRVWPRKVPLRTR